MVAHPGVPLGDHAIRGFAHGALRQRNLSAVLRQLHLAGPQSRAALTIWTGLNRSTVGGLVSDLASRGLVRERRPSGREGPGRPSPIVEVRPEAATVLALEIFPDVLGAALVGLGGTVIERVDLPRRRERRPAADDVAELSCACRPLLASPAAAGLCAVGIAVAGVVRHHDGGAVVAPNLDWQDVRVGDLFRDALAVPFPIHVANDADLVAMAELTRGTGRGCRNFVSIWGDVGVGAGVINNGATVTGRAGYAGEVGHVPVNPEGRPCHCGSRGCWETEVGEDAILRAVGLGDGGGPGAIDAVIAAAAAGDATTLAGLDAVGRWVAIGLAVIVNVLDPDRVALTGILGRLFPYLRPAMDRELSRHWSMAVSEADIVAGELGPDAPLLGAAELALASVLGDPTMVPTRESAMANR